MGVDETKLQFVVNVISVRSGCMAEAARLTVECNGLEPSMGLSPDSTAANSCVDHMLSLHLAEVRQHALALGSFNNIRCSRIKSESLASCSEHCQWPWLEQARRRHEQPLTTSLLHYI